MKKMFFALILSSVALDANAATKNCTDVPKAQWKSEAEFKKEITARGFTIKKFKTPGTCYEIYGKDKEGKSVELYFNPVDFTEVKL